MLRTEETKVEEQKSQSHRSQLGSSSKKNTGRNSKIVQQFKTVNATGQNLNVDLLGSKVDEVGFDASPDQKDPYQIKSQIYNNSNKNTIQDGTSNS